MSVIVAIGKDGHPALTPIEGLRAGGGKDPRESVPLHSAARTKVQCGITGLGIDVVNISG
jgi:hypothetical protein